MKHRRSHALAAALMAALLAAAGSSAATIIGSSTLATIPSNSGSHTYLSLDSSGTSLNVSQSPGASMNPISGTWPGLWLGSRQESATYTFLFSSAVSFVEFYITAQSTGSTLSETFTLFNTSAPSTASFVNESGTAWDGTSLTSTVPDGRSHIRFTSNGAAGFNSISFNHVQTGDPNGSVVQEIQYNLATAAIPEPETYAMLLAGLGLLGFMARRRKQNAA